MRRFKDNPSNTPERQAEYKAKLQAMTDEDLFKETKDKIWFSAYAANNPTSCYHWQCDATYEEWERRGQVHNYGKAHKEIVAEC